MEPPYPTKQEGPASYEIRIYARFLPMRSVRRARGHQCSLTTYPHYALQHPDLWQPINT